MTFSGQKKNYAEILERVLQAEKKKKKPDGSTELLEEVSTEKD